MDYQHVYDQQNEYERLQLIAYNNQEDSLKVSQIKHDFYILKQFNRFKL